MPSEPAPASARRLTRAAAFGVLGAASALLTAGCHATPPSSEASSPRSASVAQELAIETPVEGGTLRSLLFLPAGDAPAEGRPLVLFLHGAGERGDDLARVRVHGPPRLVAEIPELARCVLVAPQCPEDAWWRPQALKAVLDDVRARTSIDPARLYVTGLSMGGYGTWDLLAEYPDLFAAAIPICGGGEPGRRWPELHTGFEIEDLLRARRTPVRAFHGADDPIVPVEESRLLVDELRAVGADVELTVYPGVGHDSWTRTYADAELWAWLFAQRRAAR